MNEFKSNEKYEKHLKFYVVNMDFNKNQPYHYNVFNNIRVMANAQKLIDKYKKDKDKKAFVKDLTSVVKWQEWSRVEYEILVSGVVSREDDKHFKIDTFWQFEPNVEMFCDYIALLVETGRI